MTVMPGTPLDPPLRLQLLRSAQLQRADGRSLVLSASDAALLALLAVDGPVPRGRVAALLWPDADAERARTSLRQRLFRLRQRAGRKVVVADAVLSMAAGVEVDIAALPTLAGDPEALPGELLAGLDYGGDELGAWVNAARESWRARRRDALTEAAARHEANGEIAAALRFAQRLAADEPLLEHGQRRLMRLHYLRGDSAAALVVFETLQHAMRRELRAAPGEETRALMRQITAGAAPVGGAPKSAPMPVLRTPRLIGRDRAWAALGQAWAASRPVLLVGEPGIGKSRLLADFAQGQPGTLQVQGRIGDAAVPYTLLARLVRATLTSSGRTVAELALPEAAREQLALVAVDFGSPGAGCRIDALRLQRALHCLLEASAVPALAVDDLHHADAASLDLLASLWAQGGPTLKLALAVRAAEMPRQLMPDGDEEPTLERIELTLLDAGEVGELLDALALTGLEGARWSEPLHRHTHGNPLFILETLRALLQRGDVLPSPDALPLPTRVGQVIEQRLARLSERGLHLARVAALAGPDFSLELAATLIECPLLALSEPWRELEAAQVLYDGGFVHDLVLEATRRSVPPPIAKALHWRIASFLAARQVPPARLAAHWFAADAWARAAVAWSEAAAAAYVAVRLEESVACRESAIECYARAGDHETANEQSVHNVAALIQSSSGERALAAGHRGVAIAVTPLQRTTALVMLAHVQVWLMQYEDCLASSREAYAIAATVDDAEVRCNTACRLAAALGHLGRAAEALPVMEAVRELALTAVPVGLRCQYLGELGNVQMLGDAFEDAACSYKTCIEIALAAQELLLARQALHLLAVLHWQQGLLAAAESSILTAIGLRGEGHGEDGISRNEAMQLGVVRRAQGRYAEAIGLLTTAVDGFRGHGPVARAILAENNLAQIWLDLGQPGRAHQQLATPSAGQPAFIACTRAMMAARVAAALSGRAPPAAVDLLRGYATTPDLRTTQRLLAALELARHESPAEGLRLCSQVFEEATVKHCGGVAAHARIAWIRQCLASDAAVESVAALLTAPAEHGAIDLYAPEAARVLAQAWAVCGDREAQMRSLQEAVAWIQSARQQVPAPFIESFLRRNPINLELLAAADGRG